MAAGGIGLYETRQNQDPTESHKGALKNTEPRALYPK